MILAVAWPGLGGADTTVSRDADAPASAASTNPAAAPGASTELDADQAKALLDRATAAILSPHTAPADLDLLLQQLNQAVAFNGGHHGRPSVPMYPLLISARDVVKTWQDYLMDEAAGNRHARLDLQNLADRNEIFAPIPRSKLLDLAQRLPAPEGMISVLTAPPPLPVLVLDSIDDVPKALEQVENARAGRYSPESARLESELRTLETAHDRHLAGDDFSALQILASNYTLTDSLQATATQGVNDRKLATIREQFEIRIIQNLLKVPSTSSASQAGSGRDYLEGLAKERARAGDWPGLQNVLEVMVQVNGYGAPSFLQDDLLGVRSYLLGNKLEAAGQHLDAIRSYRQSLDTLGHYFTGEAAGEKLREMEAKYPADAKEALLLPIAPKAQ